MGSFEPVFLLSKTFPFGFKRTEFLEFLWIDCGVVGDDCGLARPFWRLFGQLIERDFIDLGESLLVEIVVSAVVF